MSPAGSSALESEELLSEISRNQCGPLRAIAEKNPTRGSHYRVLSPVHRNPGSEALSPPPSPRFAWDGSRERGSCQWTVVGLGGWSTTVVITNIWRKRARIENDAKTLRGTASGGLANMWRLSRPGGSGEKPD